MHVEQKRIFVGNLPLNVDEKTLTKKFSPYGKIVSTEIKSKDNFDGTKSTYAFINLETDYKKMQTCFQTLSNYNWQGFQIKLELAKERFLDRLKREREESNNKSNQSENKETNTIKSNFCVPSTSTKKIVYHSSSDSDSDGTEIVNTNCETNVTKKRLQKSDSSSSESEINEKLIKSAVNDEKTDFIIKNNKFKAHQNGLLKIESVNSKPIHIITKDSKNEKNQKFSKADEKRKQSLIEKKNAFNQQKSVIQKALSKIDTNKNNKIIFDDEEKNRSVDKTISRKKQKLSLFDEDDDELQDINFKIKEQFQGKKGQDLLNLQSRYNNDSRFKLDERFAEDGDNAEIETIIENEKEQQLSILESVLGKKLKKDTNDKAKNIPKAMIRFDPSNPEHSKFEITKQKESKKKKQEKEPIKDNIEEQPPVEVSKDQFYKINTSIKDVFQKKQEVSLLNMFGNTLNKEDEVQYEPKINEKVFKNKLFDKNPFKYDSSDSEDETTHLKDNKEKIVPQVVKSKESFFFKVNDKRLNDGYKFLSSFDKNSNSQDFSEKRKLLKEIFNKKVRNLEHDKRKFRKKLGKRLKVKKAQKRK